MAFYKNDVFWMCVISVMVLSISYLYLEFPRQSAVEWDFGEVETELRKHVYGQDEAIEHILQLFRQENKNAGTNPRYLTVNLLGGPGVGRKLVLNIIKKHLRCKYTNEKVQEKCEIIIKDNIDDDFCPYLIVFAKLNINVTTSPEGYYTLRPHLAFGADFIIGNSTANGFTNSTEYETYVFQRANDLKFHQEHRTCGFSVVIFKPLKHDDVTRCLQDQQVNNVTLDYSKDFVPLGCKTR